MTVIASKGTTLQQTVAAALVDIAQVISLDFSGMESETFESDSLDNTDAGIPHQATGRTEGGSVSGELWFDPALQGQNNMQYMLDNPGDESWNVVWPDSATTSWAFTGAGLSFAPKAALNDGLKASFSIKIDGLPTFPVAGSV